MLSPRTRNTWYCFYYRAFLANQCTPHSLILLCVTTIFSRKSISTQKTKREKFTKKERAYLKRNSVEITGWLIQSFHFFYSLLRKVFLYLSFIVYSLFKCYWILVFIQTTICESQEWLSVKQYLGFLYSEGV